MRTPGAGKGLAGLVSAHGGGLALAPTCAAAHGEYAPHSNIVAERHGVPRCSRRAVTCLPANPHGRADGRIHAYVQKFPVRNTLADELRVEAAHEGRCEYVFQNGQPRVHARGQQMPQRVLGLARSEHEAGTHRAHAAMVHKRFPEQRFREIARVIDVPHPSCDCDGPHMRPGDVLGAMGAQEQRKLAIQAALRAGLGAAERSRQDVSASAQVRSTRFATHPVIVEERCDDLELLEPGRHAHALPHAGAGAASRPLSLVPVVEVAKLVPPRLALRRPRFEGAQRTYNCFSATFAFIL